MRETRREIKSHILSERLTPPAASCESMTIVEAIPNDPPSTLTHDNAVAVSVTHH